MGLGKAGRERELTLRASVPFLGAVSQSSVPHMGHMEAVWKLYVLNDTWIVPAALT